MQEGAVDWTALRPGVGASILSRHPSRLRTEVSRHPCGCVRTRIRGSDGSKLGLADDSVELCLYHSAMNMLDIVE